MQPLIWKRDGNGWLAHRMAGGHTYLLRVEPGHSPFPWAATVWLTRPMAQTVARLVQPSRELAALAAWSAVNGHAKTFDAPAPMKFEGDEPPPPEAPAAPAVVKRLYMPGYEG